MFQRADHKPTCEMSSNQKSQTSRLQRFLTKSNQTQSNGHWLYELQAAISLLYIDLELVFHLHFTGAQTMSFGSVEHVVRKLAHRRR